jgi:hypothetical protein
LGFEAISLKHFEKEKGPVSTSVIEQKRPEAFVNAAIEDRLRAEKFESPIPLKPGRWYVAFHQSGYTA